MKPLALAVVDVKNEVVLDDVIAGGEAELMGGLIDGLTGAFEFDVGADGGFIEVDDEVLGPLEAGGETVSCAELFITEPAAESEAFKDFLEHGSVGEDGFELLADFVTAVGGSGGGADGEFLGRALKGEEKTGRGFSGGALLPCRSWGFRAYAEELTVLGEPAVGSVEDEVVLMDAREAGLAPSLAS